MRAAGLCFMAVVGFGSPAAAEWRAGNAQVTSASQDARIAAVLETVNRLDRAVIDDDHAAFAALMSDDLVVNNPQNTLSVLGATTRLNAGGRISYVRYDRVVEYAGLRGDMVLLMGEELCVPKPPNPMAGHEVHRRFTELWKPVGGGWVLTARQATIIAPRP